MDCVSAPHWLAAPHWVVAGCCWVVHQFALDVKSDTLLLVHELAAAGVDGLHRRSIAAWAVSTAQQTTGDGDAARLDTLPSQAP